MFNVDLKNFNELEMNLYNFIIKNEEKVTFMTIRELAEEVHVSTTTVLRFCKKFHVSGFSEFKAKLKNHLKSKEARNTEKGNINLLQDTLEEFYERTLSSNLKDEIKECGEIIKEYENVIFIGVGNSGPIAAYGAKYMAQFGKLALCIDDPYYPIINKNLINSAVILISVSGENHNLLRMANKMKSLGAKVISITNQKSSSLSKISDYNLSYYITRNTLYDKETSNLEYRDITSHIPVLYIIEELSRTLDR